MTLDYSDLKEKALAAVERQKAWAIVPTEANHEAAAQATRDMLSVVMPSTTLSLIAAAEERDRLRAAVEILAMHIRVVATVADAALKGDRE